MNNKQDIIDRIGLHLQGPMILLEKIANGRYAPKTFAQAALLELKKADALLNTLLNTLKD
ncbi:MAG: hypothetical protein HY591_00630 [Candidatus Omnitrophica bacterium]|nr:hypothetical protein [Candidatus Omnitrophota bacterium]